MFNCRCCSYWLLIYSLLFTLICMLLIQLPNKLSFLPFPPNLKYEEQENQFTEIESLNQPRNLRMLNGEKKKYKDNKIILLWTNYFDLPYSSDYYFFLEGNETFVYYQCPVSSCITTRDRTFVERVDAIIFHQYDFNITDLPECRKENQRWIFYNLESPTNFQQNWGDMNHLFNWTMSYRDDSDVVVKYGQVSKHPPSKQVNYDINYLQNKTEEIVWFVSHCDASSNRWRYVEELTRYINVDIYGNCGNKTCEPIQSIECYETVLKDYKFYLSFENSICKDYASEKLFDILNYDIIPVVMGGADYASISPPNSYIHTKDYPNPKHLAEYLKLVGSSETLYNSYFKWKGKYKSYLYPWMCELCEKLHNNKSFGIVKDMLKWWEDDAECKTWKNGEFISVYGQQQEYF